MRRHARGGVLPLWLYLAPAALAVAAAAVQTYRLSEVRREWSDERLELSRAALRTIEAAQAETARLQGALDGELKAKNERIKVLEAERARSGSALDGLRNQLKSEADRIAVSEDSVSTCRARESATRELLAACATEYQFMGSKAAGHSEDSLTFQRAWPVTNVGVQTEK